MALQLVEVVPKLNENLPNFFHINLINKGINSLTSFAAFINAAKEVKVEF